MGLLTQLQQRARDLRTQTYALYLASRHPATPWYAKLLVAAIVAYALSPIDLIPDFIPILGYVDDVLLMTLGFALAIKLIPEQVMRECRQRAQQSLRTDQPVSLAAGAIVIAVWLALAALGAVWVYKTFMRPL